MPVLDGRSLVKRFGERIALDSVSLAVEPGEVVAVIGPNGAGKTTLLAVLAGVYPPDSGEVDNCNSRFGWVPQRAAIYARLTVRENLRLFAKLERIPDVDAAVTNMLDQIGLTARADDRSATLSGGMRQRLSVGVGLIADPAVLLLDEPTAALDPLQRARLWEFLKSLADRGIAIVFTTHVIHEVEQYADRVLVMDEGKAVFTGQPRGMPGGDSDFEAAFVSYVTDHANRSGGDGQDQ